MSIQIKHELDCMERGSQKFFEKQDRMRDKGNFDQTYASTRLIRDSLDSIAELLRLGSLPKAGAGRLSKYDKIVTRAAQRLDSKGKVYEDWHAVAFIGVQALFQSQGPEGRNTILQVGNSIATRLEADLKCRMFEEAHPAYYNVVMQSFTDAAVEQYQHKHRVMMLKFNEFGLEWTPWGNVEKIQIAVRVLHACLDVLADVFFTHNISKKGKTVRVIDTTVAGDDWLAECEASAGALVPLFEPTLAPPMDWTDTGMGISGGYHHPKSQSMLPFIKARDQAHKDWIADKIPQQHMDAINSMQATKWDINSEVLAIQQEAFRLGLGFGLPNAIPLEVPSFPEHLNKPKELYTEDDLESIGTWKGIAKHIHGTNKINKGKVVSYMSTAALAARYNTGDGFHFVYNCDFRGRIYCATSGLTPQGEDLAKGLLRFHEGVELGESGIHWLAVQAANVFGNDKIRYADREQWMRDNEQAIRLATDDPIANRAWWTSADKPWQFLAALYEWRDCDYGRDTNAIGYIPVGLDGSCNGIQHYSAMLRDSVGGRQVNLIDSDLPEDIYGAVATVCLTKLDRLPLRLAELWILLGINRKLAKRPVMTLPYGSTQQSCRQYIYEYVLENKDKIPASDEEMWEMAKLLTPLMWESIGEVVIAARQAMDWLQGCTKPIIDSTDKPVVWITPIGFPVYQRYMQMDMHEVRTALCGGIRIDVGVTTPEVNRYGQRNGIAPNFIHSIDSTHMVMTINHMPKHYSLAMIHDDFGTHAGRTQELYSGIRSAFVDLYERQNPLIEWYYQQCPIESSKPFPEFGDLDITEVLGSTYFFG